MDCVICGVGVTAHTETSMMLQRDGTSVIFRDVPADVCQTCGEKYFDEKVSRSLSEEFERAAVEGVRLQERSFAVRRDVLCA